MKSTEKVMAMLEVLQDQEDEEIAAALPIAVPPPMLRGALVMVAAQLPDTPDELDAFLTNVGEFCLSMRSDRDEIPAQANGKI
jgi:hypothetical protein